MRGLLPKYFIGIVSLSIFLKFSSDAFTNSHKQSLAFHPKRSLKSRITLGSGDLFENFRKLWGGDNDDNNQGNSSIDEDLPAGTSLLASIPVKAIKPGGLRLFLMFYCMGMQNTPDRNTWRADQPTSEEYIVEMLFHDASGILTIELLKDEIRILRSGSNPSTAYIMQESVILQGILNELRQCAFEETVPVESRLLVPESADVLDIVAEELAFG